MALLHLTNIKPGSIEILQRLGNGDAGEVYKAIIPSFADGQAVALKVFKHYQYPNYRYVLSKAGHELSPFDRELKAYSVIAGDPEAQANSPVVEAYGWFEVPAHLRIGKYQLSQDEPLKVMMKKLVKRPHFDFTLVPPEQMIEHRNILDRLQIYDMDIKPENFLGGRLADLSASYVLSDLICPEFCDIGNQCHVLKEVILRHYGWFSDLRKPGIARIKQEWERLLAIFEKDPNELERAAYKRNKETWIVTIN